MERPKLQILDPNTGIPEDEIEAMTQVGSLEELEKSYEELLEKNTSNTEKARLTQEYKELRRQFIGAIKPLNEWEKIDRFNSLPKKITKQDIKKAKNWLNLYKKGLINCDDDPSIVQRMQRIAFTRLK